jgi:glycosyltransferase involved in cell wall biosynthesis
MVVSGTSRSDLFCSAIIPTIGRKSLSRAVESVLNQNIAGADYELLVINDSGISLPKADWQEARNVTITTTNRRERSIARNTGAAMARGRYLHFLDDDDWLAPSAYQNFYELSQVSDASWLYGVTQLVDRECIPSIQLRHNLSGNCFVQAMAGEWIPLQASLIERKAFLRLGGFNPLLSGPEDIDLLRRLLIHEQVAEIPELVAYVIMGGAGSTTDYAHHPQASRWAREAILDEPGAFSRMRSSAHDGPWEGRMSRVYLTSAVWNLTHWRLFSAVDRLLRSSLAALFAGVDLFDPSFWRAVLKPYASITFEKGIQEAKRTQ